MAKLVTGILCQQVAIANENFYVRVKKQPLNKAELKAEPSLGKSIWQWCVDKMRVKRLTNGVCGK